MSESASISAGIAARYATAIFEIAKEGNGLSNLESSLDDLSAALAESDDLAKLVFNPVFTRSEQRTGIVAVAQKMGLDAMLTNALALMADKRRLFILPELISQLRARLADERGEVTAAVVSAVALTDEQTAKLSEALAAKVGKTVKLKTAVDEDIIGGLIVTVGSKMIDTSIRSRLGALQNAMKEVG
ncbi:F0F1 ATP synthase subunit delta [Chachezhania sediminis]|uniref:F0F1 ATP synthase subunit delta n=1 Tax=Chachezhania sediminis TaxID=2599291 RepID=UPI00131CFA58|nr:F0F1 ATP synthase subunit delta [Chachezhania sediminis]